MIWLFTSPLGHGSKNGPLLEDLSGPMLPPRIPSGTAPNPKGPARIVLPRPPL